MFTSSSSLIYLDMRNFDTSSLTDEVNIFNDDYFSLIYCVYQSKAPKLILSNLNNENNDCNDDCFKILESKIIIEKNKCIDICENDDTYKYEYKNICYISCPN
jgi:hypothetical protein